MPKPDRTRYNDALAVIMTLIGGELVIFGVAAIAAHAMNVAFDWWWALIGVLAIGVGLAALYVGFKS